MVLLHSCYQLKGKQLSIEIQEQLADMARRSFEYNDLTNRLLIHHMDLKCVPKL